MADAYITSNEVPVPRVDEVSRISIETAYEPLGLLNSPAVERVTSGVYPNKGGNSITVWALTSGIAAQDAPTDGSDLESDEVTWASSTVALNNKVVLIGQHDYVAEDIGEGFDFEGQIGQFVGNALRPAMEEALLTAADATTLTYNCAGDITYADIVNAKSLRWGHYARLMGTPTLVVHSKILADIMQLSEVKNSNAFSWGTPGPAMTGVVPMLNGMRVVEFDHADMIYDSTNYYSYIIGERALKLFIKKELGYKRTEGTKDMMGYDRYDSRFAAWLPKIAGKVPVIRLKSTSSLDD